MVKLPELNRHIVGLSAIAVAIAGLGYAANVMKMHGNRPVARLESLQPQPNEISANTTWNSDFLSMMKQIPPNAYGRAPGADEDAAKPQGGATDSATEAKNWTPQDWRVAAEAVEKLRSARAQAQNNSMTGIVWAPPEEIANKSAKAAR
jgi:hypothetical protein